VKYPGNYSRVASKQAQKLMWAASAQQASTPMFKAYYYIYEHIKSSKTQTYNISTVSLLENI